MGAITIEDLNNAKVDVDHIAAIATSLSATATDRLGSSKRTIAGAMAEINADVLAVDAAAGQAIDVGIPAAVASLSVMNNRGAWAPTVAYTYQDIVSNSGSWYVCVVPHTSSGSFASDEGAKWRLYQGITQGDLLASGGSDKVGFIQTGYHLPNTVGHRLAQSVSVKDFGALGDGTYDDTAAIQAAIDSLIGDGGVIHLPVGTYRTSAPILLYSNIALVGDGRTSTYIKPLNSAVFTAQQGVVMTAGFVAGANLWNYYYPYPTGLHMGVGLNRLCIDGNRANVANANGLMIYGGAWKLRELGVINTQGHGIWTECGKPVSSTSGDDLHDYINMHEAHGEGIYITNANKHGWLYEGPNDSNITDVQIKTCGWAGFYQTTSATTQSAGLKIGTLHAYSCNCAHDADGAMVELYNVLADKLYIDASLKNGLRLANYISHIGIVWVILTNKACAGNFYDVLVESPNNVIGMLSVVNPLRTSGSHGGTLWVKSGASGTQIAELRTAQDYASTVQAVGMKIEGDRTSILNAQIKLYSAAASVAFDLNSNYNNINASIDGSSLACRYQNATGSGAHHNKINLVLTNNTVNYTTESPISPDDIFNVVYGTGGNSTSFCGEGTVKRQINPVEQVTYAATITPNCRNGSYKKIGLLTGATAIALPLYPADGDRLTFQFQQDGTGGRAITWNSAYKTNYSNTGNTAWLRASVSFRYDSVAVLWVQEGGFSGWF